MRRSDHGRALRLYLAADGRIDADVAILATGNLPSAPLIPDPGNGRYIADPWEPGALKPAMDGSPVIVAGTGLTMLDVAVAITDAHPRAVVHAVSRHGLLPLCHHWPRPGRRRPLSRGAVAPAGVAGLIREAGAPVGLAGLSRETAAQIGLAGLIREAGTPVGLAGLIREVRASAAGYPGDWQDVVDALRPQIPRLWDQLTEADKRAFLRLAARYWEVHRHRMPPATARRIGALRSAGRLSVLAGRVTAAGAQADGVRVRVEGGGPAAELSAGWLINCTGPAGEIMATADPLLRQLLDAGLARPGPLRLGLDADAAGRGARRGRQAGAPTSSPSVPRCAGAGMRPRPSRRSATRPRRWAACWSPARRSPVAAAPRSTRRSAQRSPVRAALRSARGQPMSRRRSPARPAAPRTSATPHSQASAVADTVPPGSLGACVNGEMSRTQCDTCSTWPNRLITTTRPRAVHAPAIDAAGASPNSATATPAMTSTDGS